MTTLGLIRVMRAVSRSSVSADVHNRESGLREKTEENNEGRKIALRCRGEPTGCTAPGRA